MMPVRSLFAKSDKIRSIATLVVAVIVVVASAFALYYPAVSLPLLSQDYVEVELGSRSPWQFFVNTAYIEPCFYYRPLWRLYDYALNAMGVCGATADAVRATHMVSIVLHALCGLLIFLLLRLMTNRNLFASALGALTYVCHPALTAIVVWISARWALYTGTVFLLAALMWELLLAHTDVTSFRKWQWWIGFVFCFALVLCVPFVAEAGVAGMGAIGLWILFRLWQKLAKHHLRLIHGVMIAFCLALIPVAYFYARWHAVGCLFGGLNNISHIPLWQQPALWLLGIEQDFNILLGPFAISWLDVPTHRDLRSPVAILLSGGIVAFIVFAPLCLRRVRRFFAVHSLPLFILGVFLLFQTKSLWQFIRPPVGVAGYYRGYAYVLAVIALALLVGLIPAYLKRNGAARWVRVGVTGILSLWVVCSAVHTHRSVALWQEAGAELIMQENMLRPWLTSLPENTMIRMEGFDDYLVRPWCQQAFVWDMTHKQILENWAGKPLKVSVSTKEHPLPALDEHFDVWIVRPVGTNKMPSWERVKPQPIQQ